MRPATALTCTRLEAREVPAAGLFADIVPGVWGSYPQNLTPSGDTLFFSAEDRHRGTELFATDGTPAGTRLVKDIHPGRAASIPVAFRPAGNGVVFFLADDGTGRTLWKSDGTAAGTAKVTGLPPEAPANFPGMGNFLGWNGELYFLTPDAGTGRLTWAKTNGTGFTVLTDFNGTAGNRPWGLDHPMRVNGDRMEVTWLDTSNRKMVWQTDGTTGRTHLQQTDLYGYDWATGWTVLSPGVEIGPDKYVFTPAPSAATSAAPASVWVGSGFGSAGRQLVKRFDAPGTGIGYLSAVNGKAYFSVLGAAGSTDAGLWVTDGTTAGTQRLDVPVEATNNPPWVTAEFDGRALVQSAHVNGDAPETYYLTDGTAVGTAAVPRPSGAEAADWRLAGIVPADAANPRGLLVFHETATDRAYRTDGTPGGTALIDRAGLPAIPASIPSMYWWDPHTVRSVSYGPSRGVYFKGDVYYSGSTATQRPELWKWDVTDETAPTPAPAPAPRVTGTLVNDGAAQRSMVRTLTVTFDAAVSVDLAGVRVSGSRGGPVEFRGQVGTANGVTTLTVTFPGWLGGSIGDGRWTLTVAAGAVTRQAGGTAMAADYTFGFTRVYGDLSGDGTYDREARTLVRQLLGEEVGDPGYNAALDWDGNGRIDAADELAAVRNWGKAV